MELGLSFLSFASDSQTSYSLYNRIAIPSFWYVAKPGHCQIRLPNAIAGKRAMLLANLILNKPSKYSRRVAYKTMLTAVLDSATKVIVNTHRGK